MKNALILLALFLVVLVTIGAVSTNLEVTWDKRGQNYAIQQSTHIDARVLAAGVAESHTVPANAIYVVFSAQDGGGDACSFYANFSGTAAEPSADITDGSGSELNPAVRALEGATAISLLAPEACILTLAFYKSGV